MRKEAPIMRAEPRFRSTLLPLLVAGLLFAGDAAADDAQNVIPKDIRQGLFTACLTGPNEGWIAGDLGRVFRTQDGGKTWKQHEISGRRPFFSISCLDSEHVWVSSTHARIFHTADGGATWKELEAPGDRNLLSVQFVNEKRGTAVGDFGLIVHTEDGGATWEEIHLPDDIKLPESALEMGVFPGDILLYALSFPDADHGWVAGEFGAILKTEDGGKTWTQQTSGVEGSLFGIHFTDLNHGIAVGIDSVILATEDGGQNWRPVQSPFQERAYYDVRVSGSTGWIVGGQGTLLVSSDGGKEWREFPTPIRFASEWFRGLTLMGDQGYIVGGDGLIYAVQGTEAKLLREETAQGEES
jgi:photosystem II stability/assembly factor-like uncharacterized protein